MKRILYLLPILSLSAMAQEPADALRFGYYTQGATARVQAIGGAMGSLGGDISALYVNPAGLGFYRTKEFVFTPQFRFDHTDATYLNSKTERNQDRFSIGTTGFVTGWTINKSKKSSGAFSIAFNRTADFNARYRYSGVNYQSSYSQKFLDEIGNVKDGNAVAGNYPFGASLAFNTLWIDTVGGSTNGNFNFQSRSTPLLSTGLAQEQDVTTRGGIYEFAIGGAYNMNERLMFGATLGIPYLYYSRNNRFRETDNSNVTGNQFIYGEVQESFKTRGGGANLKLGVIYRPTEYWRVGLAFHTPTFFLLDEESNVTVTSHTETSGGALTQSSSDLTDPQEFQYVHFTPYRAIGSISYVLREIEDVTKQRGFLTADVEYVNYASSSYTTDPENESDEATKQYLKGLNGAINTAYKGAFNFRAGAELKFNVIMFRFGGAYYGNPYRDLKDEKGERIHLTGGLGYRNKGFFIDLSYMHNLSQDVHYAYRLQNGAHSGANLRSQGGNVVLTGGVKF